MAIQATVPIDFGPDTVGAYIRIKNYTLGKTRMNENQKNEVDGINAAARAAGSDVVQPYPASYHYVVADIEVFPNAAAAANPSGRPYTSTHVDRIKIREPDELDLDGDIPTQVYTALKTYLVNLAAASAISALSDITNV